MNGRSKGVGVLTYCTLAAGSGVIRLGKHVQLKVQRSTSTIIILNMYLFAYCSLRIKYCKTKYQDGLHLVFSNSGEPVNGTVT